MDTTVQFRTDLASKLRAQRILEKQKMDLSTAMNIYLIKIIETNGLPFDVIGSNPLSPAEERAIQKEVEWAKQRGKRYSSAKKMFQDILDK